jgi:hypothetical protein
MYGCYAFTALTTLDRFARGVYELDERSVSKKKKEIDEADTEVAKWVICRFEKDITI